MQKLMKWAAVIGSLFAACAMSLILYVGSHKVVVVADDSQNTVQAQNDSRRNLEQNSIVISDRVTDDQSIYIPVESSVTADGITIQTLDMYQKLEITLSGATADFFRSQQISGDVSALKNAYYVSDGKDIDIFLSFSDVYECNSRLSGNRLQINLQHPEQLYDKIVVLDDRTAADTGEDARHVIRGIATDVKKTLAAAGIRVYETASAEDVISDKSVIFLTNHIPADLYIGIAVGNAPGNRAKFGTYAEYNGVYFMPQISNAGFADMLERETVMAVKGKANGLSECRQDSILNSIQVPAAVLYAGYISSDMEAGLLKQDDYQNVIAGGICKAVQDAYSAMNIQ